MSGSRIIFPLALGVSVALHAAAFAVPNVWLKPVARTPQITARLDVDTHRFTHVLKNNLDPAGAKRRTKKSAAKLAILPQGDAQEQTVADERRIVETQFYPAEALTKGLEGEAVLLLQLDQTGGVVKASVATSSGFPILDEAALSATRHMGSLGESAGGQTFLLPVRFKLL